MNNYVQFLAAKMTLDDINQRFLSTKEIGQFLEDLEDSMKQLRTKSQLKLIPLVDSLDSIHDCSSTVQSLRQLTSLLKLQRSFTIAMTQEDDIGRAISLLQKDRGVLQRAAIELSSGSSRSDSLEKVLFQLDQTYRRAIERIGQKIQADSNC